MIIRSQEFANIPTPTGPMRTCIFRPAQPGDFPGIVFYSEIFQLTGPIRRMAAHLAGHGYIVAVPEIYHEFEAPGTVLSYEKEGSDRGNALKTTKSIAAYDADARAALSFLNSFPVCNGRLGVMGVCIGGHLAFRAALQQDVRATVRAAACFYATDLHSSTLGEGKNDDSLARAKDIQAELLMIWGRQDPHVPFDGRTHIRQRLEAANLNYTWHEVNAAHAFLRDEGPRHDPNLFRLTLGLALDLFQRRLNS